MPCDQFFSFFLSSLSFSFGYFSLSFRSFFMFMHQSDLCILAIGRVHATARSLPQLRNSHQPEFHDLMGRYSPKTLSQSLVSLNFLVSFLFPLAKFPTVLYIVVTKARRWTFWYQLLIVRNVSRYSLPIWT